MPRNGSGVYALPSGINPVVTQTLITSNWANTTLADVAAALTASLAADGQTVPTANLPMGGFRHTGVGDAVARDNYASFGMVQDGRHDRLTAVTGVNNIAGTLLGGVVTPTLGQIIQLIPTSTNTGAVTLSINGGPTYSILTETGAAIPAGYLVAGRPYLLSFNGAAYNVIAGSAAAGFAQAAMSGWDRPAVGAAYPTITQVNPTTVNIPAGKGRIIIPSARDLSGVTEVSWPAQNVTLTNVANAWMTVLAIGSNGLVQQFTGQFSPSWARQNILLGNVSHPNGVIANITTRPAIFGDMTYAAYDTASVLNNQLMTGGRMTANASSAFHVDLSAGLVFSLGLNQTDNNSPNVFPISATPDMSFYPITGTSGVSAATQNVPVTTYDPNGAGVITAIGGGATQATIHRMYLQGGTFLFAYGQQTYPDLATALNQLGVDDSAYKPATKLVNATFLGYIVVQKNCLALTDTSTARIVNSGSFNFSVGTAGSISEAPIDGRNYGRSNSTWQETIFAPRGAAGTLRMITYATAALNRWLQGANDTPEGGSNAGSDWELRAFNDAGSLIGVAMRIARANFAASVFGALTVDTPSVPSLFLNNSGNAADQKRARMFVDAGGNLNLQLNTDADVSKSGLQLGITGGFSLFTNAGTFFGMTSSGIGTVQPLTQDAIFQLQAPLATKYAELNWKMGNGPTGMRWGMRKDNTAESGSNAGGDLHLTAYSDTGVSLGDIFKVTRSTQLLDFLNVAPQMNAVNTPPAIYASSDVAAPTLTLNFQRRTTAGAVLSGQKLGGFFFNGASNAGATAYLSGAGIEAYAAENFDATHGGTQLRFGTIATGGSTTYTNRWTIQPVGDLFPSGNNLYNIGNAANQVNNIFASNLTIAGGAAVNALNFGKYTPTLTNVANATSLGAQVCSWMRVGDTITVSGRIDMATTAGAGTLTQVGISLPVACDLAAAGQLGGTGASGTTPTECCAISPDQANDRAQMAFYAQATASRAFMFQFTYRITA